MSNQILLFMPAIENGGIEKNFLWLTNKLKKKIIILKFYIITQTMTFFFKNFSNDAIELRFFNFFFKKE